VLLAIPCRSAIRGLFPGYLDQLPVFQPYAYGPDLEGLGWKMGHARLLSLMPITAAEHYFKVGQGQEALVQRLEDVDIDILNPSRVTLGKVPREGGVSSLGERGPRVGHRRHRGG
jgi:hypothetical protein